MGACSSTNADDAAELRSNLRQEEASTHALKTKQAALEAEVHELRASLALSEEAKARLSDPKQLVRVLTDARGRSSSSHNDVRKLRHMLCDMQAVMSASYAAIDVLIDSAPATSRAGYLRSLPELIGPPPIDRSWEDEWVALRVEYYRLSGQEAYASEAQVKEKSGLERTKKHNRGAIDDLVRRNWPVQHAEAYTVLSLVAISMSRALRECDPCYAAATYMLCHAIFEAKQRAATHDATPPPRLYAHLSGRHSLVSKEPLWARLQTPDGTGFRGLTSSALVTAGNARRRFTEQGSVSQPASQPASQSVSHNRSL